MALRALKTEEEIAGIPLDQEILVELPGATEDVIETKTPDIDPSAKKLQDQLEAMTRQVEESKREAAEARKLAADREREAIEARTRSQSLEGDIINGGLSAAQSERDAAKVALQSAGEAGDWKAIADAQSRIGRAEAKILSFESGAAEIAERKEIKPAVQEQVLQKPIDPVQAIRSNPNLMPAEKEWMENHLDAVVDGKRNAELGVAYERAIKRDLVRGTPAYFAFIEEFMGYKKPDNDGDISVQAPPSRNERDGSGRPMGNTVRLSPEQRDLAKNMGISDIEYARQVAAFEVAKRADPDKYRGGQ